LRPGPRGGRFGQCCVILNYLTAFQMLHRVAAVVPGSRILVHGAARGVGSALVELGAASDCAIFGTASKAKHALLRRLGAVLIDYRSEDFVTAFANPRVPASMPLSTQSAATIGEGLSRLCGRAVYWSATGPRRPLAMGGAACGTYYGFLPVCRAFRRCPCSARAAASTVSA
jgi:hypothetical protein